MLRVSFLALLLAGVFCFAQAVDTVLTGTATDPSEAVVAGARVGATNTNTGVTTRSETNASGVYVFPSLQPGTYRIAAEMQGFRSIVITEVSLEVGARLSVDLRFEVGDMAQSVEVTAEAANLLGYETATVAPETA